MVILPIFVVIVLEVVNFNLAETQKRPLRVLYGKPDTENEYSFVVSLMFMLPGAKKEVKGCTGSLIAERWVLTAAHCPEFVLTRVRFGDQTEPFQNSTYRPILKMIQHPKYKHPIIAVTQNYIHKDMIAHGENDIALLLIGQLKGWMVGVLSALNHKSLVGLPVKFAGFGKTFTYYSVEDVAMELKQHQQTPLQVGEGVITRCDRYITALPLVCVAPKCSNRFSAAARGDSGGPLLFQNKIVGVCSLGEPMKEIPIAGYVPVSPYLDWINLVITSTPDFT